jgi:hypothetical protein
MLKGMLKGQTEAQARVNGRVNNLIACLASQAGGPIGKALLRFSGCESRHIRGLTRPVFCVSLRDSRALQYHFPLRGRCRQSFFLGVIFRVVSNLIRFIPYS